MNTRRAEIDGRQTIVGEILADLGCEAALLFMPHHVAWFTGGLTSRGLIADIERPGIYTNGKQRWLVCSNVDSQRLFDEELDNLGFQLKEWNWTTGRPALLSDLIGTKQIATDRPFPGMPLLIDRLRPHLASLPQGDRHRLTDLGQALASALGDVANDFPRGETEQDVAGRIAKALFERGLEPVSLCVTANDTLAKHRRRGSIDQVIERVATLQATATRGGMYATASRTVCFGVTPTEFRKAYDAAYQANVIYRTFGIPRETLTHAIDAASVQLQGTAFEYEWRQNPPAYTAGWYVADELRKAGVDEPFREYQPIVWQTCIGPARIIDTYLVTDTGSRPITHVEGWPFRRIQVNGNPYDVPEILGREG